MSQTVMVMVLDAAVYTPGMRNLSSAVARLKRGREAHQVVPGVVERDGEEARAGARDAPPLPSLLDADTAEEPFGAKLPKTGTMPLLGSEPGTCCWHLP